MITKQSKKRKGLTMVELIVTLAVMGLVIGAASQVMLSGFETYALDRRIQNDQVTIRNALTSITRDIHQADVVRLNAYGLLELTIHGIGTATYYQNATDHYLMRNAPDDWPTHFAAVRLRPGDTDQNYTGFRVQDIVEVIGEGQNQSQRRFIEITLRTAGELTDTHADIDQAATMEITQRVVLQRVPTPLPTTP